ncbi:M48 family metalloprotease [Nocardioides nanhaiensis]|uniref:M48 family peptidase n=1 Tax=Nocardioides nanhaiensis TaxID=1476871 RepID=A0ABP8WS92_9ACTN
MSDAGSLRVSAVTAGVGGLLFVVLAWWLVPWDPVPGGPLDPAPVGSVLTAEQVARAESFATWSRVWSWSALVLSLALACWFGFTRRGRGVVARVVGRLAGRRWWVQAVLAVVLLTLAGRLLTLPLAAARRQLLLDAGLSTQTWSGFARDVLLGELVTVAVTSAAVLAVLACARRWRRAWPAVAGGLLAALVLGGSFAYPVVVEPLFNSFTSLPDGELRTEVLAIADAEGVPVDDVLVADASRRTTTLNAYVSGFGGTRRVVLYDTLVEDVPQSQTLSIVAHELAHARHDDVVVGTVLGASGALASMGLLGLVLALGRRRGWPGAQDASVVPVLLALAAVAMLLVSPIQNGISRQIELRADVDALRYTGDRDAFVDVQQQLAVRSLADPSPPAWSQFWFGSHPGVLTRTALAFRVLPD